MLKKIYQADFFLLPDKEFWHIYILLRKGEDFYYECAGRCTEKEPDSKGLYSYEHACFTLEGQVHTINEKMRPSLIAYIQSWTKAGELNSLLKKEEAKTLAPQLLEQLQYELKGYYFINSEMEKLNKRFYAKGTKLIELAQV